MRALKRIRNQIEKDPGSPTSIMLSRLVLSLEGQGEFDIKQLYELEFNSFELALELLAQWRLDRHYSAKFRLMDVSLAAHEMRSQPEA